MASRNIEREKVGEEGGRRGRMINKEEEEWGLMPEQLNRGPCGMELKRTAFALGGINNPRASGSL